MHSLDINQVWNLQELVSGTVCSALHLGKSSIWVADYRCIYILSDISYVTIK